MKPRPVPPGTRFNKLTYIAEAGRAGPPDRARLVKCRCDCGAEVVARLGNLKSERTKACPACYASNPRRTTHGKTDSPEYRAWDGMKNRCFNPKCGSYRRYGARGVTVCERWLGKNGAINFLADLGPRPSRRHSLDRQDNEGNYTPENCRWATHAEQMTNTRRNRKLTHQGRTQTATEWARELGLKPATVLGRVKRGYTAERALHK